MTSLRTVLQMSPADLGSWVYERRMDLRLSQTALAELAQIDRSAVIYVEKGTHAARPSTRSALWFVLRPRRDNAEVQVQRVLRKYAPEIILRAAEQVRSVEAPCAD